MVLLLTSSAKKANLYFTYYLMYNQNMIDKEKKIITSFLSEIHIWFFYGFLLTFTLSIRKILKLYPLGGQFNEYSGIYLYISDIFLILTLVARGYTILCNNKQCLSNIASRFVARIKNVPHGTFLLIPFLLVVWSFISLIWADNKIIALFRSFKLTEFYFMYLYIIYNVPRGTFLKRTFQLTIALGFFQAIIGIWQFIIQHSVGLFWLKESLISSNIDGVAKIVFHGDKFIRAYGLFPHPNILGGFLLVSIILTLAYDKMFHVEHLERSWKQIVPRGTMERLILAIQIIAMILTFSKSATIGIFIASTYFVWKSNTKMFHVEHFTRKLFLVVAIIITSLIILRPDTNSLLFKSLNERLFYLNVSRGTISNNSVVGVGSGQFVLDMDNNVPRLSADSADGTLLEPWQYQPVHNVFLLIWSELGIIGLFLFTWFLCKLFHVEQNIPKPDINCSTRLDSPSSARRAWNNDSCSVYRPIHTNNVPRGTFLIQQEILKIFKGALLGLIFIMLFDHYLWDIQQGQIILWLIVGLIVGIGAKNNEE